MKKTISVLLVVIFVMTITMSNAFALYDAGFVHRIYGDDSQNLFDDYYATIEYEQMTVKMYEESDFRNQSNMTFRAYDLDGSVRYSNAISFYPGDEGDRKLASYINGAGFGYDATLYGSIPSSSTSDYAYFEGLIKL